MSPRLLLCAVLVCVVRLWAAPALAQPAALALTSPAPLSGGKFGAAVALLDDIDGDGVADVAVGAPYESADHVDGRVYIFSGATGALLRTVQSPEPVFLGAFGATLAALGDMDGDGIGDVAVGAPGEAVGSMTRAGRVYVLSGATGAVLVATAGPQPTTERAFGRVIAALGDLDGDGARDLAVMNAGAREVLVISGRTGALLRRVLPPPGSPETFNGRATLAGVPDLDGDGTDDLAVGNDGDTGDGTPDPGTVSLFSGATGAFLGTVQGPGAPSGDSDYFGFAVAGVPDLDGDGAGDLLVGAPFDDPIGAAYVFSGRTRTLLQTLPRPAAPRTSTANFGTAVAAAGDLSGDGVPDLLVAAPVEDEDAGRVYVYSGADGTLIGSIVRPAGMGFARFGTALDADAGGRIAVGAPFEQVDGRSGAGRAYRLQPSFGTAVAPVPPPASVRVWPNPAAAALHVEAPGPARLRLTDALGRTVRTADVPAGRASIILDVSALPAGVYLWRVVGGAASASGRVVVQ